MYYCDNLHNLLWGSWLLSWVGRVWTRRENFFILLCEVWFCWWGHLCIIQELLPCVMAWDITSATQNDTEERRHHKMKQLSGSQILSSSSATNMTYGFI